MRSINARRGLKEKRAMFQMWISEGAAWATRRERETVMSSVALICPLGFPYRGSSSVRPSPPHVCQRQASVTQRDRRQPVLHSSSTAIRATASVTAHEEGSSAASRSVCLDRGVDTLTPVPANTDESRERVLSETTWCPWCSSAAFRVTDLESVW